MLSKGDERSLLLRLLVDVGEAYGAQGFVGVKSAHLSGISYFSVGDEGLAFLEDMSVLKVSVPTTCNPVGFVETPSERDKQRRILFALKKMGIRLTLTCTPYEAGNKPQRGTHVAWAESSAAIYANSVLGAFTNREASQTALASAVLGVTPAYGYHLERYRQPKCSVRVTCELSESDCGLLGFWIGEQGLSDPAFEGLRPPPFGLKQLGASLGTFSDAGIFFLERAKGRAEKAVFDREELIRLREEFSLPQTPDLVYLGCPHASAEELALLDSLLKDKPKIPILVTIPPDVEAKHGELVKSLVSKGVEVAEGKCLVVSNRAKKYEAVLTNSCKAAHYVFRLHGVRTGVADLRTCVRVAVEGHV